MNQKLAELLFPDVTESIADYEAKYPERQLEKGAKVTRLAPSPTGFVHIGNLYGALIGERLAHQSGGSFFLRIEDTDDKRRVEGAERILLEAMDYFEMRFDEGVCLDGQVGDYGPYRQSERVAIYHTVAKTLVERDLAYPSFASEEELAAIRAEQEKQKIDTGYYGKWATDRKLSYEEVEAKIKAGLPWVLRLRSNGNPNHVMQVADAIRGSVQVHPNNQDFVLLKTNGVPTYHFAHVVDDHFMRVTHVVRGEEWLATLPFHLELFEVLGWEHPVYCHNAHLMKIDEEGTRRKLSKRKDPEMSLSYYAEKGYFPEAVREYLMILVNSDYEEWRLANPKAAYTEFEVTLDKMAKSGALYDMVKLEDVSKETLLQLSEEAITERFMTWAERYQPETAEILKGHETEIIRLLAIGRDGAKPRKDLIYCEQILEHIRYYFKEWFQIEDSLPEQVSLEEAIGILEDYAKGYDPSDDNEAWFGKIQVITEARGFALKPKDYKKRPEDFKGHIGHVSTVVRLAITGHSNSPDLWSIQQIMGADEVQRRIANYHSALQ